MSGRDLERHLQDEQLRARLNRLVPAMPPEGEWLKVQERASTAPFAATPTPTRSMAGEAETTSARAEIKATKTRPTEGRLVSRDRRHRSAFAYAVISIAVLVLLAGAGTGIFEAISHLSKSDTIVIIGDDTLGATATGLTTQTTAGPPGNGAWEPVPVTIGGAPVRCLVIDPSDSSVLYAATDQGLFKSTDATASWVQLFDEVTDLVAVDPASPSTVYAHTEDWEQRAPTVEDTVLLRSDDGGTSWQALDDTPGTATFWPLGIINLLFDTSTSPSTVYYYGWGLGKSTDRGETWTTLIPSDSLVDTVALDLAHPGTLYAVSHAPGTATRPELVRSTDGGATWEDLTSGVPGQSQGRLATDPEDSSKLYLFVALGEDGVYSYAQSTDQAQTWTVLSGAAAERARAVVSAEPGTSTGSINALAVSRPYPEGTEGPVVAAETGSPPALYVPTESGVYKSIDAGATWSQANHGLGNAGAQTVQRVVADPSSPDTVYACTKAGIAKSSDGGTTWDTVHEDTGSQLIVASSTPSVLYAWTSEGLFRSGDGGTTWDKRACAGLAGATEGGSQGMVEYNLASVATDSPDTLYAVYVFGVGDNSLYRSTDGGDTWEPCATLGVTVTGLPVSAPSDPSILYTAGTFTPDDPSQAPAILASQDGGSRWTYTVPPGMALNGVAVDAEASSTIYILRGQRGFFGEVTDGTVYRSDDAGSTWQKVEVDLPGETQWVITDPRVPGMLYASSVEEGKSSCFYRSVDRGATWEDISAGLQGDPGIDIHTEGFGGNLRGFANDLVAGPNSGSALYAITYVSTTSGLPVYTLYKWVPDK